MASIVKVLMRKLEKTKKHMCCIGLFLMSCIMCFATVLYLADLTTRIVYKTPSTVIQSGVAAFFHINRPAHSAATSLTRERNGTKFSLVIIVMSAPANKERRMVIRQTWALNLPTGVKVVFLVGEKFLNINGTQTMLNEERAHINDLIVLPNLVDDYKQLTSKVIASMKWVTENIVFDYLLKVDDDTFVRVNALLNELQMKPTERLYWGFFNNGSEIVKEGKWAEPEPYICDKYVSYALGGGYVLSKDLVNYIVDNSDKLKKFVNEDVSVGTWLAPFKLNAHHDERFRMKGVCREDHIVLHYSSINDMKFFNKSLSVNNTLCGMQLKDKGIPTIKGSKANVTFLESKLAEREIIQHGKTNS